MPDNFLRIQTQFSIFVNLSCTIKITFHKISYFKHTIIHIHENKIYFLYGFFFTKYTKYYNIFCVGFSFAPIYDRSNINNRDISHIKLQYGYVLRSYFVLNYVTLQFFFLSAYFSLYCRKHHVYIW